MKQTAMAAACTALFVGATSLGISVAQAKGISSLQTEAQKTEEAAKEKAAGAKEGATEEGNAALPSVPPAEAAAAKKEGDSTPSGEVAAAKHAPDLSGPTKGYLSAGLNIAATRVGSAGTHSLMAGEAGAGLKMAQLGSGSAVWGTFRYAAHDFDAIQDDISYRGVAEVFVLGGLFSTQLSKTLEISGGAEAGFVKLGIRDLTGFERDSQIAKNGIYAGFRGGLDWIYSERTSLGPKIIAGFGRMTVIGLGVSSGYLF